MRKTKSFILVAFFLYIAVLATTMSAYAQQTSQGQAIGSRLNDYERLKDCTKIKQNPPKICLQVPIGTQEDVTGIAQYIQVFYKFFVGVIITLAIFMIVVNGVRWLFARGNSGTIGAAKKGIESAIGAVVLVFISVALLRIINPDLISLEVPGLKSAAIKVAAGIEWCHQVPDSMSFIDKSTGKTLAVGTRGTDLGCGGAYEFFDPNDPKQVKNQCMGSACPSGGHCNKNTKECSPYYITGSVSVRKDPNDPPDQPYPVTLSLVPVCILNNTNYKMLPGFTYQFSPDEGRLSTFQGVYHYFVNTSDYSTRRFSDECGAGAASVQVFKITFALQVSIRDEHDSVADDFLLKKGCAEPISTKSPSAYDSATWLIASSHLYTDQQLADPIICNLGIDRGIFPRR